MTKTPMLAAAFFAVSTVTATAGGLAEPVMEPEIIVQEATPTGDGSGFLQWLILATIIVAVGTN